MQEFNDVVLWLRNHSVVPMLLVFVAIAAAAYWPTRRTKIEDHGMIPFREEG